MSCIGFLCRERGGRGRGVVVLIFVERVSERVVW